MSCGCSNNKNDYALRRSCVECVEKHLGAAMVLIGETINGYPYRLLAIGHLHEAEEECFDWPELKAEIRIARKDYQNRQYAPDWERMTRLLKEIAPTRMGAVSPRQPEYAI